MSIVAALMINIIALGAIVAMFQKCKMSFIFAISIIWLFVFNMPIFEWSLCAYAYALFDMPSMILVSLCAAWLVRFVFLRILISKDSAIHQDSYLLSLYNAMQRIFPPSIQYIWIFMGAIIYADFTYGFIDIYHLEYKIHLFLFLLLTLLCYLLCASMGYIMLFVLATYSLGILGDIALINYILDPFLFVGCIAALLCRASGVLVRKI